MNVLKFNKYFFYSIVKFLDSYGVDVKRQSQKRTKRAKRTSKQIVQKTLNYLMGKSISVILKPRFVFNLIVYLVRTKKSQVKPNQVTLQCLNRLPMSRIQIQHQLPRQKLTKTGIAWSLMRFRGQRQLKRQRKRVSGSHVRNI